MNKQTTILLCIGCMTLLWGCAANQWTKAEAEAPMELFFDASSAETEELAKESSAPETGAAAEPEADEAPTADAGPFETAGLPQPLSTRPTFRPRPPELLARIGSGELEPLPLAAQDVSVVIAGHRARVVLDLVFHNPSTETLAGTLMVGLPDRASPCYVGLFLGAGVAGPQEEVDPAALPPLLNPDPAGPETLLAPTVDAPSRWQTEQTALDWGRLRHAATVEPARGREVYEAVARTGVDPALAEWSGQGKFSIRLYPLPPQSFKRVVFAYDQTLVPSGGRLVFPLPSPRSNVRNSRLSVYDVGLGTLQRSVTVDGEAITPTRSLQGYAWTIEPWGMDAEQGGASDSGPAPLSADESGAVYRGVLRNPMVSYLVGRDAAIPGALVSLQVTPELSPQPIKKATGRALFVVDTSYSARDSFRELQGQLLRHILEEDDSLEHFAVLCFDVKTTLLTPGFVPNSEESREHYLTMLEQVWLEGATNFESVLEYLDGQPDLAAADTFFLLGDGRLTWGRDEPAELRSLYPSLFSKRWLCYSLGTAPANRPLFEALTRSAGRVVHAASGQDLLLTARAHRTAGYQLESAYSPLQDEVIVAGDPRLLYPGQALEVAVRMRATSPTLRLVLTIDGKPHEFAVPLQEAAASSYLAARTWAEVYVGTLLDDPDDNAIQAVFALSRHFALANDYASFIILETDEEYAEHAISGRALDFRNVQQLLKAARAAESAGIRLASGSILPEEFGQDSISLVLGLDKLRLHPVWSSPPSLPMTWEPEVLLQPEPAAHTEDTTTSLYLLAGGLFAEARALHEAPVPDKLSPAVVLAGAFRLLSTVAELGPADDQALRLLGYTLMEWGLHAQAESVFAAVRRRRPFEPQNLLLEGLAQAAQGKLGEAALRFETVLLRPYPRFGEFVKPAAARLLVDVLDAAARAYPNHPALGLWSQRRDELAAAVSPRGGARPRGRLLLFWNLDDTDVDLHVQEDRRTEVWYQNMASRTGGRLFWDNTAGLGPELYEHPRLARRGFLVSVDYFSSSSVEGAAPAATFIAAFNYEPNADLPRVRWHTTVLLSPEEDSIPIMPPWKR